MQRILPVFARFTHIGVDAGVPRSEVRCITLQNTLALVFALTALAYIPLILAYLPTTRPLLILNVAYAFPLLSVIALNALRRYLLARLFFYLYSVIFVSLSTLWMGIESNMHFFLASGLFFQFFTFPPRQRILMFMVTLANVGAYIVLETQLADNPYLLDVPADFQRYFRLGVMLGLAGFIFAISYYTYIMIRNAEAG
ncbi:MAG: hypothetical protein KDK34_16715 [Leptospiraceae bacterium]|nr:hypothetical protein [Leptospiraceae bacterium]